MNEELIDIFYTMGKTNALNLRKSAKTMTAAQLADREVSVPKWKPRDFTRWPINAPVRWNGRVYRLLQPYDGTVYADPPDAPDMAAMWGICHTKDPKHAKPWCEQDGVRNVYHKGEVYTDGHTVHRCKSDVPTNFSAEEAPELWEDVVV